MEVTRTYHRIVTGASSSGSRPIPGDAAALLLPRFLSPITPRSPIR